MQLKIISMPCTGDVEGEEYLCVAGGATPECVRWDALEAPGGIALPAGPGGRRPAFAVRPQQAADQALQVVGLERVAAAAAIAAAANGVNMARHGARAITSICGTVDMAEATTRAEKEEIL